MRKLSRYVKKLSTINRVKFIIIFPFLVVAIILDYLTQISSDFFEILREKFFEIVAVSIIVLVIISTLLFRLNWDETVPKFNGVSNSEAAHYVYANCHEMANNFIVSEDGKIRGYVRADDENIDKILSVLARYDIQDEDRLIKWLTEFRNGDYSDAVDFHNYCWHKLDGKVGYAIGLKKKYK